jgi:hypothetical protein
MWIKELAAQNLELTYNNEEVNTAPGYVFTLPNKHSVDFDITPEWMMYNDIGRLSKHRARINIENILNKSVQDRRWADVHHYITSYGGRMTCMCCGKVIDYHQAEQNVFCEDCEPVLTCSCCGEVISESTACYFVESDSPYCEDCFNDLVEYDSLTEEPYMSDNTAYIYWRLGTSVYGGPVYSSECIRIGDTYGNAYQRFARVQPKIDPDDIFCRYYLETQDFYSVDEALDLFFNGTSLSEVLASCDIV